MLEMLLADDYWKSMLMGVIPVGVFALIIMIWVKNANKDMKSMLSNLLEEQIADLKDNQVLGFDPQKSTWTQKAMITRVTEKGNSVALKLLWFNTVIQGHDSTDDFQYADIKMKKKEFEAKNLQNHAVVTMFIDPNKGAKII
ncbi:MAG: hypothetical protein R3Y07_06155 [Eubacteriales bacterium]